jgi:[protein-PII] uridylyltransferase
MTGTTASDPQALMEARTASVDQVVMRVAEDLLFPGGEAGGVAVLAVGGYGRRQLFPYSDVDLLLLFESERLALERKQDISAFLQRLWDADLRMSHSVRTPEECLQVHDGNAELNISLLDRRLLCGNLALYAKLEAGFPRFLQANRDALVRNLAGLTRDRHKRYANTYFHLEPNVKDTPGGLRDYQLLRWLEQLRGVQPDVSAELCKAFELLNDIRYRLHALAGRDQNTLTFEAQDTIGGENPAGLMRDYFRGARAVYRTAARELESLEAQSSGLFAQFRDWRSRLGNAEIGVRRERAHFRQPQMLEGDPELALRFFDFCARHGVLPSIETSQRIEALTPALERYFAQPRRIWPALQSIFTQPHAAVALRAMHETGALAAIFPELKGMECLVIRDFYHRYTVDEHTIVAIERLLKPGPPFDAMRAEAKQQGALVFATLFHDAGKASQDEGHVTASAALAATAMERIGAPAAVREMALFLIGGHLVLSAALQSRDVYDPQTIRDIAAQMSTVERLKNLTLLTYADISAVNPTAMTPWRADQLWQLYLATYNELTRELETDRIEETVPVAPGHRGFLEGFPRRYLRTHSEAEIAEHMTLAGEFDKRGVAVDVRKEDAAWRMTLAAADGPGLFAAAAGALAGFGLNILRAEAVANRRGMILDTFVFADPLRNLDLNPSEAERLRSTVERVLTGKADVKTLLRNRPRPPLPSRGARVAASVSFNSDASQAATLVEITARDRPGLLYDLASAISTHGANIEVVLIDTEAHKAVDVFYVTAGGKKLTAEKQAELAESLRAAVEM